MSKTKKESEVGLLIKESERLPKGVLEFPKELEEFQSFGKSRTPKSLFRLGYVEERTSFYF